MKQLASGKHIKHDCFPRTLKFEMWHLVGKRGVKADLWGKGSLGFDSGWWGIETMMCRWP
jgi:hypothetical protein